MLECELDDVLKKLSARHVGAASDNILGMLRNVSANVIPLRDVGPNFYLVGAGCSNYVILIKAAGEPLTAEERCWIRGWGGCCEVVRSAPDVLGAIEASYRERMAYDADGNATAIPRRRRAGRRAR